MRELETALFTIMRGTSTEMKNEVLTLIKKREKKLLIRSNITDIAPHFSEGQELELNLKP